MNDDKIVSFEEWCIQCDIRGVRCFAVSLKDRWRYNKMPQLLSDFINALPCIEIPQLSTKCICDKYYLIKLDQIKHIRKNPIGGKIFVVSHDLPFSNEIELEYIDGNQFQSIFSYISWDYSDVKRILKQCEDSINFLTESLNSVTKTKQFISDFEKGIKC